MRWCSIQSVPGLAGATEMRFKTINTKQAFFWCPWREESSQERTPPIPGTNGTKWLSECAICQQTTNFSGDDLNLSQFGSRAGLGWPGHCQAQSVHVCWVFLDRDIGVALLCRDWDRGVPACDCLVEVQAQCQWSGDSQGNAEIWMEGSIDG